MVQGSAGEQLIQQIGLLFNNVQESASNHRRTAIALRKLQMAEKSAEHEQVFLSAFLRHLLTLLAVKKPESIVQRILKFICTFMAYSAEKGNLDSQSRVRSRYNTVMC